MTALVGACLGVLILAPHPGEDRSASAPSPGRAAQVVAVTGTASSASSNMDGAVSAWPADRALPRLEVPTSTSSGYWRFRPSVAASASRHQSGPDVLGFVGLLSSVAALAVGLAFDPWQADDRIDRDRGVSRIQSFY